MIKILALTFILSLVQTAGAANRCAKVFTKFVVTEKIQTSIDNSIQALAELKITLDSAQAKGSHSVEFTALSADYKNKEQELVAYLERHQILTREELVERIKENIRETQSKIAKETWLQEKQEKELRREQKRILEQATISDIGDHRAVFNPVKPGSTVLYGKEIKFRKTIHMAATLTTQLVWKIVSELAINRLPKDFQTNPDPSWFKGDTRPVESVSFDQIHVWLRALNELSNLGAPQLATLIPGHKRGDQYRLPTEQEWDFVIHGRGQYRDDFQFGNDWKKLGAYAWYAKNSKSQTHPVALKKPLVVDGQNFYDMYGNVLILVYEGNEHGTDANPMGVGGYWGNEAQYILPSFKTPDVSPDRATEGIGFRLVKVPR